MSEIYDVTPPDNAPDQVTLEGLKARIDFADDINTDDALLTGVLDAAKAGIVVCTKRNFTTTPAPDADPVQKTFLPETRRVRIPDAREVTEVLVNGAVVAPDDYQLLYTRDDLPAVKVKLPISLGVADGTVVEVTGRWGIDVLPDDVVDAIYVHAARHYYEWSAKLADRVTPGEGATAEHYYRSLPTSVTSVYDSMRVLSDWLGIA
jgi:hypothetical protein